MKFNDYRGTRMDECTAELISWDDDMIRLDVELGKKDELKDGYGNHVNHGYTIFKDINDVQQFINRLQKQLDELKEKRG